MDDVAAGYARRRRFRPCPQDTRHPRKRRPRRNPHRRVRSSGHLGICRELLRRPGLRRAGRPAVARTRLRTDRVRHVRRREARCGHRRGHRRKERSVVRDAHGTDPEQPVAELGTDYVYHMLADAVTAVPHIAPVDTVITYGAWKLSSSYGPHVKVKWDQTYPFNSAMPESTHWDNPYYRGRYPVGCAVIAAAQIMSTLRSPYAASGQGAVYQWTDFEYCFELYELRKFHTTVLRLSQTVFQHADLHKSTC